MFHVRKLKEYLNMCNKTNKCTCTLQVLSHIVNYRNVSIDFAIIHRVALYRTNNTTNCQTLYVEPPSVIIDVSNSLYCHKMSAYILDKDIDKIIF